MADSFNPHEIRANQFFTKGKVNFQKGEYENCIRNLQYAESLFSTLNSKELAAESMLIISHAYLNLNQKKYALLSLKEAYHKFNQINDQNKKAECALKLGFLHRECDNFERSEKFLSLSLQIYSNNGQNEKIGDSWKELGNTFQKKKQVNIQHIDKTIDAYEKAIFYYKKSQSFEKKALTEMDLALVLIDQSNLKEATKLLLSALSFFTKSNQKDFIVTIAAQLSHVYLRLGKKKKATEYYKKALKIMKESNYAPEQITKIKSVLK